MTKPVGLCQTSDQEAQMREAQLDAMARAGQALATHWGHQPWSDSWARQVAEELLKAAEEAK